MIQYAVLLSQSHNRVYFEASKKLSIAELEIAMKAFSAKCSNPEIKEIGGIHYAIFEADVQLSKDDIRLLSRLSFALALFELGEANGQTALFPIQKQAPYYFGDDISMILKYTGKTNEMFTRLLINAAVYSSDYYNAGRINLLDPIAGKGTTLFEGLIAGYNCYGVEISPAAVRDGVNYLKKYLESGKYKHEFRRTRQSGENRSFTAEINSFTIAKNKDDAKSGKALDFSFIEGDSRYADKYFKKDFFHTIVGDLPYGVQHGSVSNQKQSSLTRNPDELLNSCLPGWIRCLKPGGTIALSWNKFVFSREAMENMLARYGLSVYNVYPYNNFEHRVDQSINRDIIVAKKQH